MSSVPTIASKMLKTVNAEPKAPIPYTPEEALALYIDGDYSKNAYKLMQYGVKERNCNIYPSYDVLAKTKKECYPNDIRVTERSAEVNLQSLINHTVGRILQGFPAAFEDLVIECNNNDCIKAICDGVVMEAVVTLLTGNALMFPKLELLISTYLLYVLYLC